jgi:uncharacterized membrane protein YoaK (UPF0700 family)
MKKSAGGFPRHIPFALSLIAGFVDAVIFLALFGLYVAQATGSFVSFGAHWTQPEPGFLVKILAIPSFLFGGIVAVVLIETMRERRRAALLRALMLEEALLFALLVVGLTALPAKSPDDTGALIAALCGLVAMGLQSAMVRLFMPVYGSTNVMTTNTTIVAIDLTHTALAWLRRKTAGKAPLVLARGKLANSLTVVAGFLCGTLAGAFAFYFGGPWALAVPLLLIDAVGAWIWFNIPEQAAS